MDDLEKLGDEVDRADWLVKTMYDDADNANGVPLEGAALDAYENVFFDLLDDACDAYQRALERVMFDELARSYNAPTSIRPEGGGDWDANPDYIWMHRACDELEAMGATMGTPFTLPAPCVNNPDLWRMISPPPFLKEPRGTMSSRALIDELNAYDRVLRRHGLAYRRYTEDESRRAAVKQRQQNLSTPPKRLKATPTKYVRVNGVKIPRSKSHASIS